MKKLFVFIALLLQYSFLGFAETVTVALDEWVKGETPVDGVIYSDDGSFSIVIEKMTDDAPNADYPIGDAMEFPSYNRLKVTASTGKVLTKVKIGYYTFNWSSKADPVTNDNANFTIGELEAVWEGRLGEFWIEQGEYEKTIWTRLKNIEVTFEETGESPEQPEQPEEPEQPEDPELPGIDDENVVDFLWDGDPITKEMDGQLVEYVTDDKDPVAIQFIKLPYALYAPCLDGTKRAIKFSDLNEMCVTPGYGYRVIELYFKMVMPGSFTPTPKVLDENGDPIGFDLPLTESEGRFATASWRGNVGRIQLINGADYNKSAYLREIRVKCARIVPGHLYMHYICDNQWDTIELETMIYDENGAEFRNFIELEQGTQYFFSSMSELSPEAVTMSLPAANTEELANHHVYALATHLLPGEEKNIEELPLFTAEKSGSHRVTVLLNKDGDVGEIEATTSFTTSLATPEVLQGPCEYYNLMGQPIQAPGTSAYIIRQGGKAKIVIP